MDLHIDKWQLRWEPRVGHTILDKSTGNVKKVLRVPNEATVGLIPYKALIASLEEAFTTGEWPVALCPVCKQRYAA